MPEKVLEIAVTDVALCSVQVCLSFWLVFKHFRLFQLAPHNKKVFYSLLACAATATVYIHFNESEPLSLRLGRFLNGTSVCSGQMSPSHPLPIHITPPQPSIQSQETGSECPEGRKGAVSDNIIHAQWETHCVRLLRSRYAQCWVSVSKSVRL